MLNRLDRLVVPGGFLAVVMSFAAGTAKPWWYTVADQVIARHVGAIRRAGPQAAYRQPAATVLLRGVDGINQHMRHRAIELARAALGGTLRSRPIAVWGAAFKAGIDDVRDSPALDVAVKLHEVGAHVTVYDPQAISQAQQAAPQLGYAPTALAAAEGAHLIVIATGWPGTGVGSAQLVEDPLIGISRHPVSRLP